jgi:hypothetical protein
MWPAMSRRNPQLLCQPTEITRDAVARVSLVVCVSCLLWSFQWSLRLRSRATLPWRTRTLPSLVVLSSARTMLGNAAVEGRRWVLNTPQGSCHLYVLPGPEPGRQHVP